ncbi:MAG: LysR family transcriptional regulator [Gammaproteobacteria bacterium]|nr:LysR family transcriptional regulator [Gammaproteobacteria bacterium]
MKYPPLNTLRAFEAAARHQSFLLAAKELHVSAASVSRFIKLLESDLGSTLFIRRSSGVFLTDIGELYWRAIRPSLQTIASVSQEFRHQDHRRALHIVSIPAIAETWLVSRLWSFQQQHKNIEINLVLDDKPVNLHNNDTTIWLSYSDGNIEGTESYTMPKDNITLVCNPEIAQSLNQPSDILKFSRLVDVDWQSDWKNWLKAANMPLNMNNCIYFERYSMVVNAAIAGSGVAIGHTALLETYLKQGTLVAPFTINATPDKQFYALISENPQRRAVKQFINWFSGADVFAPKEQYANQVI